MTDRAQFNSLPGMLGLETLSFSTDGWAASFLRRSDGLHLWRVADSVLGIGIQTAYLVDDQYVDHTPYYAPTYFHALVLASKREERVDGSR